MEFRVKFEQAKDNYSFPKIDFKLYNSGDATSVIYEIWIVVSSFAVDTTPILIAEHVPSKDEGRIGKFQSIDFVNVGYGPGKFMVRLRNPFLEAILRDPARASIRLDAGGSFRLELSHKNINIEKFIEECSRLKSTSNGNKWSYPRHHQSSTELEPLIEIGPIAAEASLVSRRPFFLGFKKSEFGIVNHNVLRDLVLSQTAFLQKIYKLKPAAKRSAPDTRYCFLLEQPGSHKSMKKKYKVSRKIEAGSLDHFQVQLGAEVSCSANLKIQIHSNSGVLNSNEFAVHIWNPQGSWGRRDFIDGGEDDLLQEIATCRNPGKKGKYQFHFKQLPLVFLKGLGDEFSPLEKVFCFKLSDGQEPVRGIWKVPIAAKLPFNKGEEPSGNAMMRFLSAKKIGNTFRCDFEVTSKNKSECIYRMKVCEPGRVEKIEVRTAENKSLHSVSTVTVGEHLSEINVIIKCKDGRFNIQQHNLAVLEGVACGKVFKSNEVFFTAEMHQL